MLLSETRYPASSLNARFPQCGACVYSKSLFFFSASPLHQANFQVLKVKMGFEEPEHIREFVASNEMQVFQMIIVIVEKSIAQNRVFGYFFLQRRRNLRPGVYQLSRIRTRKSSLDQAIHEIMQTNGLFIQQLLLVRTPSALTISHTFLHQAGMNNYFISFAHIKITSLCFNL